MRSPRPGLVFALALALSLGFQTVSVPPVASSEERASVRWFNTMEEALPEAAKDKKPMLLDFYEDGCAPCHRLVREVYTEPEVVKRVSNLVAVKLNAAENQTLLAEYKIEGFPTIVYRGADGKEISRISGFKPVDRFVAFLDDAARGVAAQAECPKCGAKSGTCKCKP